MNIINIGILAHVDAGKTTVLLKTYYLSGAIRELGTVNKGNTTTDSLEIEKRRGITVHASTTSLFWSDTKINIIDTPGHKDFIAEVERTLRMLDGAVLVISAKEGIQAQTKLLFNNLQQLKIPTIIFVNKIDRTGVNLNELISSIESTLSKNIFVIQSSTNGRISSICSECLMTQEQKELLLDLDDDILTKFLSNENLTNCNYWESLKSTIHNANAYPVLLGSAIQGKGIAELLNAITTFVQPPIHSKAMELSAYVYKIDCNKKGQKKAFLKVINGNLKIRSLVNINESGHTIKIKNIITIIQGKEYEADEISVNDIAIIYNAEKLCVGDYIGRKPELIYDLNIPTPSLISSIHPCNSELRSKLISAMNILCIEDPSINFNINAYTNEMEVSLYGLTQGEVLLAFLEERFSINAYFDEPKTIYKEHPKKRAEKTIYMGVHPNPYWASIGLTIEPLPIGAGLQIKSNVSLGHLNHSFQNAVFEGVRTACKTGLLGWEVTDLRVTFSFGDYFSPMSTPSDFRQLTPYVFKIALQQCGVEILEPVLQFQLQIPQTTNQKAIIDLQKMFANIEHISNNKDWSIIQGIIPVNTSKEYSATVGSYTKGLGVFITRPSGYQLVKNGDMKNFQKPEKDKLLVMFEKQKL